MLLYVALWFWDHWLPFTATIGLSHWSAQNDLFRMICLQILNDWDPTNETLQLRLFNWDSMRRSLIKTIESLNLRLDLQVWDHFGELRWTGRQIENGHKGKSSSTYDSSGQTKKDEQLFAYNSVKWQHRLVLSSHKVSTCVDLLNTVIEVICFQFELCGFRLQILNPSFKIFKILKIQNANIRSKSFRFKIWVEIIGKLEFVKYPHCG